METNPGAWGACWGLPEPGGGNGPAVRARGHVPGSRQNRWLVVIPRDRDRWLMVIPRDQWLMVIPWGRCLQGAREERLHRVHLRYRNSHLSENVE